MRSRRSTRKVEWRQRPARTWRQRLSIPFAVAGTALFVAGYTGANLGFQVLPFDRHHMLAQVGGLALAVAGLSWLGTRR